jgi:hypothetical protein
MDATARERAYAVMLVRCRECFAGPWLCLHCIKDRTHYHFDPRAS